MADPATIAATTIATTTEAVLPWHTGVDAEVLGHWQNKGWPMDNPKEVALAATKQAREAEKHFGVPAERLLRLPADNKDEAGWKDVWGRLGVPADAKDYDLAGIDPAFADSMRAALAAAHVTKDNAASVVKAALKHFEDANKAQGADQVVKAAAEQARLDQNWGQNKQANMLKAVDGARRLGLNPEQVKAMENSIGIDVADEILRKIGQLGSEDPFVEGDKGAGSISTQQGAAARLGELTTDKVWSAKLLAGDPATKREWENLSRIMTGVMEAA